MLHELREIVQFTKGSAQQGLKTVLVTVVELDGSSYRRPGVRMSVREDGQMSGAVSGGCVEKEIIRQSESVFRDGVPKLMEYDGRYRLGCEGILQIFIEPFEVDDHFYELFEKQWQSRVPFRLRTYYSKEQQMNGGNTEFVFPDETYSLKNAGSTSGELSVYEQDMKPGFRLILVGAEHDAVELCRFASGLGWKVQIIAPPDDPKSIANFPGASDYFGLDETDFSKFDLDAQTAVVLMTHSYVKDLKYLSALIHAEVPYLGLLGPRERREKLLTQLLEYQPEVPDHFLENLRGPAGINIGGETPQEIAISVLAEILSVIRDQEPLPLREKNGRIHQ